MTVETRFAIAGSPMRSAKPRSVGARLARTHVAQHAVQFFAKAVRQGLCGRLLECPGEVEAGLDAQG